MKRWKTIKAAHKCQTPIEALALFETHVRLDLMIEWMNRVDPVLMAKEHEQGRKIKWLVLENLRLASRHARDRLRKEFLSVEKEQPKGKR